MEGFNTDNNEFNQNGNGNEANEVKVDHIMVDPNNTKVPNNTADSFSSAETVPETANFHETAAPGSPAAQNQEIPSDTAFHADESVVQQETARQGYEVPRQNYGTQQGYNAPQQSYGVQQQGYGAPQQGYGAQQQNNGTQQQGYGAPQQGYGAQQQNYGTQQQGYGTQQGYGAPQQRQAAPGNPYGAYPPKPQSYYSENIKRGKPNKAGAGQLILVAILGALIGGGLMFSASLFLAPVLQPTVDSFMGKTAQASEVANGSNNGIYKKVEITQSASPIEAISEKVSPSIVGIRVTIQSRGAGFFFDTNEGGTGEGSGIIIRDNGYIITNNHVIENALQENSNKLSEGSKIEVVLPSNKEKSYEAKVVGRDQDTDIAVLKIEAKNLPVAELGNSDKVKAGELAVAIGNPGGMDYMGSVTSGIISGINRTMQMENGETLSLLQTDAAINPGNSGGALVNSQGQVIGINTVKIAASGYEGLGFAIPINKANEIAKSLIEYKYVKGRPYLGVSIDQRFNADVAKQYNVPNGLLVYEVLPLSAAYKAGVQAGDIITKFDGKTVTEFQQLEDQKNTHKPGDEVKIEVYRDGKTLTLTAKLDEEKNTD